MGVTIGNIALCVLGGYLIGNIQTAIIVSKLWFHDDVRKHGSGNAGSTNMLRVYGWAPGVITFIGDFLKGFGGACLGRWLMGDMGAYIAGFFVIIGHCWPALASFRGGKGVASSCGLACFAFPLGAGAALAVGIVLAFLTKTVSIMSLTAILLFCVMVVIFEGGNIPLVVLSVLMVAVVYIRHIDNIRRLIRGEEKPLKKL